MIRAGKKGRLSMASSILRTEKLCKSFSNGGMQQHVIKNLDLEIKAGDLTVIMGSSGSGKSTLLYALSGMNRPTMGKVFFADTQIQDLSNDRLAMFRRSNCGFVFQSIYLLENQTVLDNVLTAALIVQKHSPALIKKAEDLLEQVGLRGEDLKKYPNQLSGGEAQRVGIVRALINDPKILFADEPTGQLNSASGRDVLDIFSKIHKNGQNIIMVTHDLKTALRGTRVLYLRDGGIEGEYRMCAYGEDDSKERRMKLQRFLDEMGW